MFRILLFFLVLSSCSQKAEKIPDRPPSEVSSKKVIIYQVMTRLFGNKVSINKKYGTLEDNGVGKFNDINSAALTAIKELGVTHIWYTGVIDHASLTDYTRYGIALDDADVVKGRAGSPFAIKDYYDVNPDLAVNVQQRMKEFEELVERTHDQGLKVIIDFVPNHVARGYRSDARPRDVRDFGVDDDETVAFRPSNNFYFLPGERFKVPSDYEAIGVDNEFPTKDGLFEEYPAKLSGNSRFVAQPQVNDWFDVAKLNYGVDIQDANKKYFFPVPDTWIKMRDVLLFWTTKKIDGFRCDMVEMIPVEFWDWVIPQVKAINNDLIFIAEIYNPTLYRDFIQTGRFDFLYDKVQLYDTLRKLIKGESSTLSIAAIQQSLKGINASMLHFMENHDEQRIASTYFASDPWKAVPAMVISSTIDSGPILIYFGQEVGEPAEGDPGHQNTEQPGTTTKMDYWGIPEHQKWMNKGAFDGGLLSEEQKLLREFYARLLNLAQTNPAIVQGAFEDITEWNINQKNFTSTIHAFVRWFGDERLLIVSGFNNRQVEVTVSIPNDVLRNMGLVKGNSYSASDLLGSDTDIRFDDSFSFDIQLKPFSSFIFKIK